MKLLLRRSAGIGIGLFIGLFGLQLLVSQPAIAQSFPNIALWGLYNGTTLKPVATDTSGHLLINGVGSGTIGGTIGTDQIAFGSSSDHIAGEAALTYDSTNDEINIGTNYASIIETGTPGIRIGSSNGSGATLVLGSDDANTGAPVFSFYSSNGTTSAPADSVAGDTLSLVITRAYNGANFHITSEIVNSVAGVSGSEVYGKTEFLTATSPGASTEDFIVLDGSLNTTTMSKGLVVANGKAITTDTTTGHTMLLRAYDNNTGPGYVTFMTFTNGNTPSLAISAPAGGSTLNISGLDLSAAVAPAASGTRYLCISTTGVVTSSASACSGT